ncbi:MAG: hypothetical protein Sapg2KO_25760 [Saprospiraceae bacterium]
MDGSQTLNKAEIRYLFQFLNRKGVKYLDVKVELVDHLAEGLEECWRKQPGLPIELAANEVYETFGIFGFGKMIEQKRQLLFKATIKKLHLDILSRLQAPQIAIALLLTLLMTYLLMEYPLGLTIFLSFFIVLHLLVASIGLQQKKYKKQNGHQFLFLEASSRFMNRVLNACFLGLIFWYFWNQASYLPFVFALIASLALLYFFLLVQELVLYQKKRNHILMEQLIHLVEIPAEHSIT